MLFTSLSMNHLIFCVINPVNISKQIIQVHTFAFLFNDQAYKTQTYAMIKNILNQLKEHNDASCDLNLSFSTNTPESPIIKTKLNRLRKDNWCNLESNKFFIEKAYKSFHASLKKIEAQIKTIWPYNRNSKYHLTLMKFFSLVSISFFIP